MQWTVWNWRWATVPNLGTWLNSVILGPGAAVGEPQSKSNSLSGPVDELCQLFELDNVSLGGRLSHFLLCFVDRDLE